MPADPKSTPLVTTPAAAAAVPGATLPAAAAAAAPVSKPGKIVKPPADDPIDVWRQAGLLHDGESNVRTTFGDVRGHVALVAAGDGLPPLALVVENSDGRFVVPWHAVRSVVKL